MKHLTLWALNQGFDLVSHILSHTLFLALYLYLYRLAALTRLLKCYPNMGVLARLIHPSYKQACLCDKVLVYTINEK